MPRYSTEPLPLPMRTSVGFCGYRNVREHADPYTAGALHVARVIARRAASICTCVDAVGFLRLQAEFAEVEVGAALGDAA